jgi:hypothetical protein
MRAEQSKPPLVDGFDRLSVSNGPPDQLINLLDGLDLRPDNTHPLHHPPAVQISSTASILYDPVVLAACGKSLIFSLALKTIDR